MTTVTARDVAAAREAVRMIVVASVRWLVQFRSELLKTSQTEDLRVTLGARHAEGDLGGALIGERVV